MCREQELSCPSRPMWGPEHHAGVCRWSRGHQGAIEVQDIRSCALQPGGLARPWCHPSLLLSSICTEPHLLQWEAVVRPGPPASKRLSSKGTAPGWGAWQASQKGSPGQAKAPAGGERGSTRPGCGSKGQAGHGGQPGGGCQEPWIGGRWGNLLEVQDSKGARS